MLSGILSMAYGVIACIVSWHLVMAACPEMITLWWIGIVIAIFAAVAKHMEEN